MKEKVQLVRNAMLAVQRYPWEQGVCAQALWELGDVTTAIALAHDAVLRQREDGRLAVINENIAVTDPAANGALMCCPTKDNPYKIGEMFDECERLANAIIDPYCENTGMRKRPTHIQYGDNMTGTNWCEIPTTILEMGFMTNEADDKLMQTADFKENAAKGIADGIENFFDPAK